MDEAKIVRHKGMFVFRVPLPVALAKKIQTGLEANHTRAAWVGEGLKYFVIGGLYTIESPDNKEVHAALQFVWGELAERELVSGSMPNPVHGDLLTELRK